MRTEASAAPKGRAARRDTLLDVQPFELDRHTAALVERGILPAPLMVIWRYRIQRPEAFRPWLDMKEIVLSKARMSSDQLVGGIRYLGTWRIASDGDTGGWQTIWAYDSEDAMLAMHRLCSDPAPSTTIIQMELIDFVRGLRSFLAEAGAEHFSQDVLVPGTSTRSA